MNRRYNAVLFDLDGTLLDTALDLHAATNHILAKYELAPISIDQAKAITSNGATALLQAGFAEQYHHYDADDLRAGLLDYYHDNISTFTKPFEGVSELLYQLQQRDIPWGIVTNKPENLTKRLLLEQPELNSCAVMVAADTLSEKKPHPLPLLHAAQQLGVTAAECLYIGDHIRDIEAGRRAEMTTVSVQWGYFSEDEDPLNWQADHHIHHPAKILDLL